MIADYKAFAKELYNIKISVAGGILTDKNKAALQTYHERLTDLRPKFRTELAELAREYIAGLHNPAQELMAQIEEINFLYIKKLHAHANYIKREMKQII